MKPTFSIYRNLPRYNSSAATALTIGNFDGVHLGHQAILHRLQKEAQRRDLVPSVMTFSPHPRAFFAERAQRPELYPAQINPLRDKLQKLAEHGAQQIILQRFNHAFATLSPQHFIEELLIKGLRVQWLLIGEDFKFGHKRQGNVEQLKAAGRQHGFVVESIEDVVDPVGQRISSSDVRTALAQGNLAAAHAHLGYRYCISGHVIHGQKLGRTIGYPTLNLAVPPRCAARTGVYIVKLHGLADQPMAGVASLGVRPTVVDAGRLLLEVHLLDRDVNAYGKLVKVEFLHFVRNEEKFPDLQTMMAAIDNDARSAREYFASHGL
ncbi:MAG TPA: bifunctional riboflavin kinase/FAD synthetase [Paenalcaligenes hominis]|uniref:Riboflavin biosynthesis protein n=1 Tax=Paenalcaligenes hominis TaxID=643674 RepID=A0A9D2VGE6_9BURK|nr:bifunctional riboflavin kinase/FAD synthetase [Paenalcaligenes hominis]NJB64219.1 riboflavin kinase/FMN adenylyltransferase [Paenalcaligenes hominis]HJH24518.1 bifunctional riboflavin kinase/FAD synthetase [Paenalcaligenes hominis]